MSVFDILFSGEVVNYRAPDNTDTNKEDEIIHNLVFYDVDKKPVIEEGPEEYFTAYTKYQDDFINPIVKEPILSESSVQLAFHPIKYPSIYENYKKQQSVHWTVEEVDLKEDRKHWDNKLSNNDRHFIMHVLAFFATFDGIINVNMKNNLIDMLKIKEGECAYGKQFDMENTHSEMYALMIDTFISNTELKDKIINSIETMPAIKKKAEWCQRWIDGDSSYAHKLVVQSIIEAVFFSGAFAAIFWLKTRPGSIMPGLLKSNRFIARDENLHVELAYKLYQLLNNHLRESVVYAIIDEAVAIEIEFINVSLPCRLIGINAESMTQHVKSVADRLLVQLGYNKNTMLIPPSNL